MPMRSWLKFVMMTAKGTPVSLVRFEREGGKHTFESLVLLADQVLDGHFYIFECDVGRS